MEPYQIVTVSQKTDWKYIPKAKIACRPWGGSYDKKAEAQLYFCHNQGFFLRMCCFETNPKAVFTKNNDPVYQDSCLECFLQFRENGGYLNLEMNANGAVLCEYGTSRFDRQFLSQRGIASPEIRAERGAEYWSVETFLPLWWIEMVDGYPFSENTDSLRGNFYKCGDHTDMPHYLSWYPLTSDQPDFHRPQDFGPMILGKNR
jgi:hypothetical protein